MFIGNPEESIRDSLEKPAPLVETIKTPEEILMENREAVIGKAERSGVALDENMRIAMDADFFPMNKVGKDNRIADRLLAEKRNGLSVKERKDLKSIEEYEVKMSDLLVINFNKFLGEDYLVAKASKYDKLANGVDAVIFNKKTGGLVCALGGIGALEDSGVKEKIIETIGKNNRIQKDEKGMEFSGAKLSYGFERKSDGSIIGAERRNIPAFFAVTGKSEIDKRLNDLALPGQKAQSEEEFFGDMLNIVLSQINALTEKGVRLNPEFKSNLNDFRAVCQNLRSEYQTDHRLH